MECDCWRRTEADNLSTPDFLPGREPPHNGPAVRNHGETEGKSRKARATALRLPPLLPRTTADRTAELVNPRARILSGVTLPLFKRHQIAGRKEGIESGCMI